MSHLFFAGVHRLMEALEECGGMTVVILDACRRNPKLPRNARGAVCTVERVLIAFVVRSGDGGSGLVSNRVPHGTLLAYSCAPGQVADDGQDELHSPYMTALLHHLDGAASMPALQLFTRVRCSH